MFSPAVKRGSGFASARKEQQQQQQHRGNYNDSPKTPLVGNNTSVPNRPSTGTPAPWASRPSVLARIPPTKKNGDNVEDPVLPVYVGEFPQVVREQQAVSLQKHAPGGASVAGGLDKETSLAWIICGNRLYLWSYLSPAASRTCVVLDIPPETLESGHTGKLSLLDSINWSVCIVNWDSLRKETSKAAPKCSSAGIVLYNQKTRTLVYWAEIFSEGKDHPIISFASSEEVATFASSDEKHTPTKQQQWSKPAAGLIGSSNFNSLIASAIPGTGHTCIALACSSNGELWQFHCDSSGIQRKRIYKDISRDSSEGSNGSRGYPRSLIWHFLHHSTDELKRQFLLLTDHEIQCFVVSFSQDFRVSKLWSHEIVGTDGDLGIQKDLAGQKRIWPLDLQVDNNGKVITILIAIFCKDRVTSSSYTEYSLLTMQYKSGQNISAECVRTTGERILEKKAPIQVIIPKARVEDEDFLFSMRLKTGGKPAGSVIILSGDGTATVSHYWRSSTRLYQFDLPYDAGKVLDASVFPSSDDGDDGAWVVLTEKAGVWAIPERAVLLGGVEPPERSLSRKGSSNDRPQEEKNLSFAGNIAPRRASSEAWNAGDRQRPSLAGVVRRSVQDEESEALLNQIFNEFLLSDRVDGALDKLKHSGAFERDGETNVFARASKSIVDTLAKHWTTTRGAEIVALSIVSTQLMEKQQKHQKFLHFLALAKCHEELCSRQRHSLQNIMEHGEKLAAMIQLRELQNTISQNRAAGLGSSYSSSETQLSGALWDLIQLVGERARRNTVLLMDRDNAEVFYSKVSDLEELFNCLERQLDYIIHDKMPLPIQFQKACELSNACVTLLRMAIKYRNEHHVWYPSPEGLTPWYCQTVVRNGLWRIASFMLHLLSETHRLDDSGNLDFYSHLEALADVLLEAYSGAITAKLERGEDHKSLLHEYWDRRDLLLDSLYKWVKGFANSKLQDSSEGMEEQYEEILRKLSFRLLSISKRHECYQTLWNICCDLNDYELLRSLMHESMGPTGGFSYYVFKQLYENKQFSKLMRLGEEFPEELATFLKQHRDLLWLHELFLHQFSFASKTLHELALSQDDTSDLSGMNSPATNDVTTLADRKRFLNLSKIAALAGKGADYETMIKRIDADLKLLKLQQEILELLPDNDERNKIGQGLISPIDLIELCLKSENRQLSLLSFDVFAWTSSSFLKSNTSLLEECWMNAANQDNWERIYQDSVTEGWSDEETLDVLRQTLLFQASRRCYGPEAETLEIGFDEVLPLRQQNPELSHLKDVGSSVEAILMQHKDFPDAGKLMLTAIMLGSLKDQNNEEDGPCPMD